MFGLYRTLLALMVVAAHVGGIPGIGAFALIGFYVLSGYLMTFIMQNNYGYSKAGIIKYALNRFLKIYPMYWMVLVISTILIFFVGEDFSSIINGSMYFPRDTIDLLRNIFIFFPFSESPRLIPPVWALTVELFFYLFIGAGLSKDRRIVLGWFFVSAVYHPLAFYYGWDHYFTIFAASLSFSLGALVYHYRGEIERHFLPAITNKMHRSLPVVVFGWILLNWLLGYMLGSRLNEAFFWAFFYLNYPVSAILVIILSARTSLPLITGSFDKWVGDISYPIYLVHAPIGMTVSAALTGIRVEPNHQGFMVLVISLPLIILTSMILSKLTGRPVERIRSVIKKEIGNL